MSEQTPPEENGSKEGTPEETDKSQPEGGSIPKMDSTPDPEGGEKAEPVLNEVEEKILQVIQNWDMKSPEDEGYSEGRPHHAIKIYSAIAPIIRA